MLNKLSARAHPVVERRAAIWPWLLMPLVALAIFFTLWRVRHATEGGVDSGPNPQAYRSAPDQ
jgi:hypothetical protein